MSSKNVGMVAVALFALTSTAFAAPHGIYRAHQDLELESILRATAKPASDAPGSVKYYGGPVISHAKVYVVIWGSSVDATIQKQIGDYFKSVTDSTYFDWMTQYNTNVKAVDGRDGTGQTIGRGTFAGLYVIKPSHTGTKIDDKDIQAELESQIAAGKLPKNDSDSLYMNYFPPGVTITIEGMTSCQEFCAYHEGFTSQTQGNIFYGVMPDLGGMCLFGCGFYPNRFDAVTVVSSHELIEAVTDPFPTPADKPAFPQAWNTTDGSEIGDLCAFSNVTLTTKGLTYTIQGEYDNVAGACTKGPYQSP